MLVTGAMCQLGAGVNANQAFRQCVKDYGPIRSMDDPNRAFDWWESVTLARRCVNSQTLK